MGVLGAFFRIGWSVLVFGLSISPSFGGDIFQCRNRDGIVVFADNPKECEGEAITRKEFDVESPESPKSPENLENPVKLEAPPVCPEGEGLRLLGRSPFSKVTGLAFDGSYLWAFIYLDPEVVAVKLDPQFGRYEGKPDEKTIRQIRKLLSTPGFPNELASPGGADYFGGKFWLGGSSGAVFGSLDTNNGWDDYRIARKFKTIAGSQDYSGMAHDGTSLWMIWHGLDYSAPDSDMQRLLKVSPSGTVVAHYPADMGAPTDTAHGLAWDGRQLWHGKGRRLRSVDPSTGQTISEYKLDGPERISGMASDGCNLFIADFSGAIWKGAISRLGR